MMLGTIPAWGVCGSWDPCEFGTRLGTQLHVQVTYSAIAKWSSSSKLALEDAFQLPKTADLGFPFIAGWAPDKAHIFASDYTALRDKPSIVPDLLSVYYML